MPFIAFPLTGSNIQLLDEIRIFDVNLVGIDSNYWPCYGQSFVLAKTTSTWCRIAFITYRTARDTQ